MTGKDLRNVKFDFSLRLSSDGWGVGSDVARGAHAFSGSLCITEMLSTVVGMALA
jgi:hypothetical protein